MTDRYLLILANDKVRDKAVKWVRGVSPGTRLEFKGPARTLEQNDKMWAMLTDISQQATHHGGRYSPDDWKVLALTALGSEMRLVPALSGSGFVPLGVRSSKLTKAQMSELLEFLFALGAEKGVLWSDPMIAREEGP